MKYQVGDKVVTPYMGVWIETKNSICVSDIVRVTPYMGVWIETAQTIR